MRRLSSQESNEIAENSKALEKTLADAQSPSSFEDDVALLVERVAKSLGYPTTADRWKETFLLGLAAAVKNGFIPNDLVDRLKDLHQSVSRGNRATEALQRVCARAAGTDVPRGASRVRALSVQQINEIAKSSKALEETLADAQRPSSFEDDVALLVEQVAKSLGYPTSSDQWKHHFLSIDDGLDRAVKNKFLTPDLANRVKDLHQSVSRGRHATEALQRVCARAARLNTNSGQAEARPGPSTAAVTQAAALGHQPVPSSSSSSQRPSAFAALMAQSTQEYPLRHPPGQYATQPYDGRSPSVPPGMQPFTLPPGHQQGAVPSYSSATAAGNATPSHASTSPGLSQNPATSSSSKRQRTPAQAQADSLGYKPGGQPPSNQGYHRGR
jgi:hypothetical protein